jgi:TetR/AcrR family transcriptional repressor of nem operon
MVIDFLVNYSRVPLMARPARLSPEDILDLVLPVFWRNGFDGTSLADLEAATGLGRQCLYNHYADKEALYHATLHRYQDHAQGMLAMLRRPDATLDTIADFFALARAKQRQAGCGSCMMAKVAAERPSDHTIVALVRSNMATLMGTFAAIVERAKAAGTITDQRPSAEIAAYIWSVGNGAAALSLTDDGDAACDRTVRFALALLSPATAPTS